ncbi:MAG: CoA transferase [Pseudomonadales bacterium]|jgi:formyl-CoA transferase|nr:CoA transferase [Pseudomonadales bacterium]MDP7596392.1 CoA transferase [Pseudomonadales bacterium]HJN51975.1 CoA transferase [Pseudomonadales bacterium]|tara:strand:- start:937 stop:2124 length:1188 start_codon:yes stop_codon:yes gene_type:complete
MPALDGMRILDMTQYEAGTSCTQALAWFGADVVKVERPGIGDPGRGRARGQDDSDYFLVWNSNKRSIAVDLEKPAGRELLLQMLPHYDVFVENYGPGVIEKLDLGYDVMKAVHPEIIYARLKGFGTSGPYADYKCFDMVAQAAAGAFSITGEADGPPMRPGPTTGDAGTGVQLALAITAAYAQKMRTGVGQLIEISMQEAMTYYLRTAIAGTQGGKKVAARSGNGMGPIVNIYPCDPHGPNDYIYIMAVTPRMWESLCHAMERPDLLQDERFSGGAERYANREALKQEIAGWTSQRTKQEAMRILGAGGVPASAVLDSVDLFSDPHLHERGFIHSVEHETRGTLTMLGWPARLSESEVPLKAAPLLGKHSDEVIAADLALSEQEIAALHDEGIIG